MIKKLLSLRLIVIMVILSSACNLPMSVTPLEPQPQPVPEDQGTPSPVPVSESDPTGEYLFELEDTLTGLMDNYARRIENGEWTEEEGLVKTLQFVTGRVDAATINPPGTKIISYEGSGVVRAAAAYIKSGPDAATRTQLQELIDHIFVDPATLERLSKPAGQGWVPGSTRLAKLNRQDINCATIWTDGFPPDSTATCFEYRMVEVGGKEYRLYIPVDMSATDNRMIQADDLMEGLPTALNAFLAYGDMPSADLVFTQLPDPIPNTQAITWMESPGAHCQIAIFPEFGNLTDPGVANQVIAHELFHCYQFENFFEKTSVPGTAPNWWIEGTAEFFGNVAYPTVNAEHEYIDTFSYRSVEASLVKIDYPSFLFFQYLANQRGEQAVIDLISQMPETPGIPAQLSALAGYPDIANLFHQFGRAYIDRTIQDTGGGNLPRGVYIPSQIRLASTNEYPIPVGDFVLERRLLIFPSDTLHTLSEDYDSSITAVIRPRGGSETSWTEMPENMQACEERQVVWLATSGQGSGGDQTYTLSDEVEERDVECDRCLVGSWRLDNASMWAAFENLMASSSSEMLRPTLESFDGEVVVRFTQDGLGTVNYNGYNIVYTQTIPLQDVGNMRADANVNIQGEGSFVWNTTANTNLSVPLVLSQPVYTSKVIMTGPDGTAREMPANPPIVVIPGDGTYTCSPTTLLIDNGGFVEPIKYDKISP